MAQISTFNRESQQPIKTFQDNINSLQRSGRQRRGRRRFKMNLYFLDIISGMTECVYRLWRRHTSISNSAQPMGAVLNSKWKLKYFKFKIFGDLQRTAKKWTTTQKNVLRYCSAHFIICFASPRFHHRRGLLKNHFHDSIHLEINFWLMSSN